MTPETSEILQSHSQARAALAVFLVLVFGLLAALIVAQIAMSPPGSEQALLAGYLSVTGAAAVGLSWLLLRWLPLRSRFRLREKVFLGSAIGGLLGLLNTFIIAERMFISTSHDLWVLAAALAFSVAVMASFSFFVATSVAERLDQIRDAVHTLAADEPDRGLPGDADEVDRLASEVAHLSKRLHMAAIERAQVDEERRLLTASVSHDLRTPVASVRAIAEALSSGVVEVEADRQHYLGLLQREIDRLSRMIDDLFELAQMDAGSLRMDFRRLQLEEIVSDVIEGMKPQARDRGLSLVFEGADDLPPVQVDGARMERVVANLVRNAIEHSSKGGQVRVVLNRESEWLVLSVRDEGEGFDEAHAGRIWQRFYRVDEARTRHPSSDGVGLGLSIVKGLVEAHGGTAEARSARGRGSEFTVRLPV